MTPAGNSAAKDGAAKDGAAKNSAAKNSAAKNSAGKNGTGKNAGKGKDAGRATATPGRARTSGRPVVPGELLLGDEPVPLNPGRPVTVLRVLNTGDRPVQVGSHLHFPAANDALDFDRAAAWGQRLDVPAGTAVRFEPGVAREVSLVPLAGSRVVPGLKAGRGGVLDDTAAALDPVAPAPSVNGHEPAEPPARTPEAGP